MIQEIMHNCVRHAKATEVTMQLEGRNNDLFIRYMDNGVGFNFDAALKNSSGCGLRSLKSRVDIMNGAMQAQSGIQQGTQFVFQIPIK